MKKNFLEFIKSKSGIIICLTVILIIFSISFLSKKNYKVFLDLYMPIDSYGYVVYSPGNQTEFNLYKDSYLNIEYDFSDNKNRKIDYIISNSNIISIEDNKIYAKNIGETTIYIKTKDNIKSNIISINVINTNDDL